MKKEIMSGVSNKSYSVTLFLLSPGLTVSFPPVRFQRQDPLQRRVRHDAQHRPAARLRQEVPGQAGLQEAHKDEHAHGHGGKGEEESRKGEQEEAGRSRI